MNSILQMIKHVMVKSNYTFIFTSLIKTVQLLWFSYIRIYLLLFIGYKYSFIFNNILFVIILWSIYILGIVWCIKQYINLKRDINSFFKINKNLKN